MKLISVFFIVALMVSAFSIPAEEKEAKIALKDLPSAVHKTVNGLILGAELKGLFKEEENGKTFYEAETIKNGKTQDALIDTAGIILELEESTTLN